ncbi:MAG TPA: hypothetical protein VF519_05305 [Mycobacteriales bacterium]|jgi:hypothetical protein
MGAHRLDRTGRRAASLAALALLPAALAACSGGDDPAPTAPPSGSASGSGPSAQAGAGRREVARVDATVEQVPEGVTAAAPTRCVQYEVTGGERGTRYQVDVVLGDGGRPSFTGPAGTKVFYRIKVEAGGQAFDGYATFGTPRQEQGHWLYDPDDLSRQGTAAFQPESFPGIQEVPAGLTGCHVSVRRPDQEPGFVPGTRMLRDGEPVVVDVAGETHPIDEA